MKNGKVIVKKSEIVYESPLVKVMENTVLDSNGKQNVFSTVNILEGVGILPIDEDNNVYLIEEHCFAVDRKIRSIAGGGVEKGEIPLEAAKRELKEELGIEASEWKDLGTIFFSPNILDYRKHIFLATGLKFSKPSHEATESIKPVKMRFDDAYNDLMENRINSESAVAILKAKNILGL